jgi:SAM-dependent methyltransferase
MCGSSSLLPVLDLGDHPVARHFLSAQSEEEYVHPVRLHLCESCGLVQLVDPVPAETLYADYVCLSSWKAQPHVPGLADLVQTLPGLTKTSEIVEAGCNDGSFLEVLQRRGFERVIGVEPARDAREAAQSKGLRTLAGFFTPELARDLVRADGRCDLFVARQVLEHATDLGAFVEAMGVVLAPGGYVLIEVPNLDFMLRWPDYSAVWEDHVNYFSLTTLTALLASIGVEVTLTRTVAFSGEALVVVGARTGESAPIERGGCPPELRAAAVSYGDRWPAFRSALLAHLDEHRASGGRAAVYGAGNRACGLLNFTGAGSRVEFVVDDQPEKQGKYMPGSRLPIVGSEMLTPESADLCLLAVNAENEDGVIARHSAYVAGGRGRFESLLPPSERLPAFWEEFRWHD